MPWKNGQTKNWHYAKAGAFYANRTKRHIRGHRNVSPTKVRVLKGTETTVLATALPFAFVTNPLLQLDGAPSEGAPGDWVVVIPTGGRYPKVMAVPAGEISEILEATDAD